MSGPQRIPLSGGRSPGQGGGRIPGPGLAALPPKRQGSFRWWLWLILLPVLLLGLTYLLGRTVEPVRQRLVGLPLAGQLLFADKVWPILWNKPPEDKTQPSDAAPAKPGAGSGSQPGASAPNAALTDLEAEIAARLTAAEVRETAVAKKEAELKALEAKVAEREAAVNKLAAEAEAVKAQLEGQLRTETDRVAVIRAMKSSAVTQLFNAMTDDEILRVLKYMTADEVGKHLASMDSYRSARILHRLTQLAPAAVPTTTP